MRLPYCATAIQPSVAVKPNTSQTALRQREWPLTGCRYCLGAQSGGVPRGSRMNDKPDELDDEEEPPLPKKAPFVCFTVRFRGVDF